MKRGEDQRATIADYLRYLAGTCSIEEAARALERWAERPAP